MHIKQQALYACSCFLQFCLLIMTWGGSYWQFCFHFLFKFTHIRSLNPVGLCMVGLRLSLSFSLLLMMLLSVFVSNYLCIIKKFLNRSNTVASHMAGLGTVTHLGARPGCQDKLMSTVFPSFCAGTVQVFFHWTAE